MRNPLAPGNPFLPAPPPQVICPRGTFDRAVALGSHGVEIDGSLETVRRYTVGGVSKIRCAGTVSHNLRSRTRSRTQVCMASRQMLVSSPA